MTNTSAALSDERLRNTRAWAAARIGTLSGAEVIVGAIDEALAARSRPDAGMREALRLGAAALDHLVDNIGCVRDGQQEAARDAAAKLRTLAAIDRERK